MGFRLNSHNFSLAQISTQPCYNSKWQTTITRQHSRPQDKPLAPTLATPQAAPNSRTEVIPFLARTPPPPLCSTLQPKVDLRLLHGRTKPRTKTKRKMSTIPNMRTRAREKRRNTRMTNKHHPSPPLPPTPATTSPSLKHHQTLNQFPYLSLPLYLSLQLKEVIARGAQLLSRVRAHGLEVHQSLFVEVERQARRVMFQQERGLHNEKKGLKRALRGLKKARIGEELGEDEQNEGDES